MPITQSAKKAMRQNLKRKIKNTEKKDEYKRAVKEFRKLVAEKKNEEAKKYLPKVYKSLDKAAKTNVIKKNRASRLKSRLTKSLPKV